MINAKAIQNSYLVYGLTEEQLKCVAELADERAVAPGEVICREGERGDDLFIVLDGRFAVKTEAGELLAEVGADSVIGEMGLIESRPRSASVEAMEVSRVAAISQRALRSELIENGDLAFLILCNVARLLSDRLRGADAKLGVLMSAANQS